MGPHSTEGQAPLRECSEICIKDMCQTVGLMSCQGMLSPQEIERNELGYYVEEVRRKSLRVIKRSCPGSNVCVFMVHGGGGRAGQFKHQIKALESE